MKKFTNPQEYKDKTGSFTHRNKCTIKNCYYMFDEAARLIDSGRLSYDMTDDALLLFRDEGNFYHVSFIAAKDSKTRIVADKLCTTGIVAKGEEKTEKLTQVEEAAKRLGFTFRHCNRMYSVDVEAGLANRKEEYLALERQLKEQGFEVTNYNSTHFDAVKKLWDDYLVTENILAEDWKENIGQSVLVFDSGSQACVGVVMPRFSGNNNLSHIVVAPEYRSKKISFYLCYNALISLAEHGLQQAGIWIADDNIPSLKFHKKYFDIIDTKLKSYSYSCCFDGK